MSHHRVKIRTKLAVVVDRVTISAVIPQEDASGSNVGDRWLSTIIVEGYFGQRTVMSSFTYFFGLRGDGHNGTDEAKMHISDPIRLDTPDVTVNGLVSWRCFMSLYSYFSHVCRTCLRDFFRQHASLQAVYSRFSPSSVYMPQRLSTVLSARKGGHTQKGADSSGQADSV